VWRGRLSVESWPKLGVVCVFAVKRSKNAPEFTRTVRVAADGQIRLPMLKQRLRAEGLLPAELESAIAQALKNTTNRVDETMPGSRRCFSRTSLLRLPGGAHAPCAAASAWLLERWQPV
jgi:hypothetical protein